MFDPESYDRFLRNIRKGVSEDALDNQPAMRTPPQSLINEGSQVIRYLLIESNKMTYDEIDDCLLYAEGVRNARMRQ